ncbi:putative non-specific serine/threonine protein kinase [Helianthus annuus]|nr:putative non-specific serine/threonine protein kinase [Helianthus annuus]
MKEQTDDVSLSVKDSTVTVDSTSTDVKIDDVMVDVVSADVKEDLERETVTRDLVMEDVAVVKEVSDDRVESRVGNSEKVEVVVSEESVEVVKEVIESDCDDKKSGIGSVVGGSKTVSEPLSKEVEAGGGDVEVSESVVVVAGEEKTQKETEVLGLLKNPAEDGVNNQSLLTEVVDGGTGEDNVHVSNINMENQAGVESVDQTNKESFQSTVEATTNGNSKMAVEIQDSTKILESEDSKMDDEKAENLDQKAEVDQMSKEDSTQSTTEVRTDNVLKSEDSKMDDEPQVTEEEVAVKDKTEDLEKGLTKETVDQPTGSVQEMADGDHVMNEKTVKDSVLTLSKISRAVTMASLGLEDDDVVIVDEGSDGKHETQDSVSVELSLVCPDNQGLTTAVGNAKTGEVDQKVEVGSTSKDENTYATKVIDEVTTVHKELVSHVQVLTDGGISVTNQSMKDNDVADSSKVVETDMEPVIIGGDTNNIQENQDSTVGVPNTEFSYEEVHMDRGEDAGMDIDEVLGWKDEIPSVQEDEQKADPTNLSNIEEQVTESLKHSRVSLQQSHYFHPAEREGEFSVSDLVWGKVRSHPWWPGQIFDSSDASEKAMKYHKKDCFLVAYFGDRTFGWNDSTALKPFREYFSQIEREMNSEAFNKAVHCALVEVSRRVELGLTCSCIPHDIYENIKCKMVENSGIKQESSRIQCLDKSASVNSFEPDKLVDYVRLLATVPYGESDKMELTMAKAQLSSYGRYKGHRQLAEFQLCGDLLEAEQVIKDEIYSEDGSKNRKALDSIPDGLEKRPLKGEPADNLAGNSVPVPSSGNQADMLSQLHLAAQDPMKGHSFVNNVIPFFKGHRAAVVSKSKKRKASNENELDEFEVDDVNDSYWTDRIIQNHPEEQVLQENNNITGGHQVVVYEQENPPVKPTRRSNKKRFFNSNHEIEANEQSELIFRRQQNLATEVLMKFAGGIYFPSEVHLNKMFRRFGPLMESETEVDRQSGRARVVFKKCSDAEVAHSSAGKFNIFGSISVTYELNYTPMISYKPLPLPVAQDPPHAC